MKSLQDFINNNQRKLLILHGSHSLEDASIKEGFENWTAGDWKWDEHNEKIIPFDLKLKHGSYKHHALHEFLHRQYPLQNKDVFKQYTSHSTVLNNHLHNNPSESRPSIEFEGRQYNIHDMDNELSHHSLKHELHVYSGVRFNPEEYIGDSTLPAYTSTTTSKEVAAKFAKLGLNDQHHIIHMILKPGQHGSYIGEHSSSGNENEFLLPRQSKIHITGKHLLIPRNELFHGSILTRPLKIWEAHVK